MARIWALERCRDRMITRYFAFSDGLAAQNVYTAEHNIRLWLCTWKFLGSTNTCLTNFTPVACNEGLKFIYKPNTSSSKLPATMVWRWNITVSAYSIHRLRGQLFYLIWIEDTWVQNKWNSWLDFLLGGWKLTLMGQFSQPFCVILRSLHMYSWNSNMTVLPEVNVFQLCGSKPGKLNSSEWTADSFIRPNLRSLIFWQWSDFFATRSGWVY